MKTMKTLKSTLDDGFLHQVQAVPDFIPKEDDLGMSSKRRAGYGCIEFQCLSINFSFFCGVFTLRRAVDGYDDKGNEQLWS